MCAQFRHYKLQLETPRFESPLTDLIIELDYLRKKPLGGTTNPQVFFQLKGIFHYLESIGSARIEGNRTTTVEFIEAKIEGIESSPPEAIREIINMEKAMGFIDETIQNNSIDRMYLSELHKLTVDNLTEEGSKNPGFYRKENVKIASSKHIPPDYLQVENYMKEFFNFINQDDSPKYDLLKTAIAHHRFAWIHPFDNGNGRVVRLLTYAMLVKQGFGVSMGTPITRILNPTAVFCNERKRYYDALSNADNGTRDGILDWCYYVLLGLKEEIEKVDNLLDYNYLQKKILLPAITFSLERKVITDLEARILRTTVEKQIIMASDIKRIFPNRISADISRILRHLKDKKMLAPIQDNARKYVLRFDNNFLLRGIIHALGENDFLPTND